MPDPEKPIHVGGYKFDCVLVGGPMDGDVVSFEEGPPPHFSITREGVHALYVRASEGPMFRYEYRGAKKSEAGS